MPGNACCSRTDTAVPDLKHALASGFFITCQLERVAPLALIALATCIATVFAPEGGPLFMVAGDPNGAIGTTIGFIGNVVDPVRVADSALRASFVYTVVWIPVAAIAGVAVVGAGTSDPAAQLSQARGVSGGAAILSRLVPTSLMLMVCYLLSCLVSFACRAWGYGIAMLGMPWGLAVRTVLLNCLLLCAVFLVSSCLAAMLRAPLPSLFLALALHIGPLLAYPNAYIAGAATAITWASPTVWLMHTCSLNITLASCVKAAALGSALCLISLGATYVACDRQEACR